MSGQACWHRLLPPLVLDLLQAAGALDCWPPEPLLAGEVPGVLPHCFDAFDLESDSAVVEAAMSCMKTGCRNRASYMLAPHYRWHSWVAKLSSCRLAGKQCDSSCEAQQGPPAGLLCWCRQHHTAGNSGRLDGGEAALRQVTALQAGVALASGTLWPHGCDWDWDGG